MTKQAKATVIVILGLGVLYGYQLLVAKSQFANLTTVLVLLLLLGSAFSQTSKTWMTFYVGLQIYTLVYIKLTRSSCRNRCHGLDTY